MYRNDIGAEMRQSLRLEKLTTFTIMPWLHAK